LKNEKQLAENTVFRLGQNNFLVRELKVYSSPNIPALIRLEILTGPNQNFKKTFDFWQNDQLTIGSSEK